MGNKPALGEAEWVAHADILNYLDRPLIRLRDWNFTGQNALAVKQNYAPAAAPFTASKLRRRFTHIIPDNIKKRTGWIGCDEFFFAVDG